MKIAIVKYNAGNIQSVLFALDRIGAKAIVTDEKDQLLEADKVIFPGVGEASSAMHYLRERGLDELILSLKQPVLGICLGMQLLCDHSEENETKCLGIFPARVKRFTEPGLKVPQVGWNQLTDIKGSLFTGVNEKAYCYFVHSYFAELCSYTTARTDYGGSFSSALARDNFYGVQFHTEKSAGIGDRIFQNFLAL